MPFRRRRRSYTSRNDKNANSPWSYRELGTTSAYSTGFAPYELYSPPVYREVIEPQPEPNVPDNGPTVIPEGNSMPVFKHGDRIKETTTTTGTGNVTLAGAVASFRTFATRFAVGDSFVYEIIDNTTGDWEVGKGTMLTSTTFSRDNVISSSTGSAVSFAAGTKDVFETFSGERFLVPDISSTVAPTDSLEIGATHLGKREFLTANGPNGVAKLMQSHMGTTRIGTWNPAGSSTGVPGTFGIFPPTTSGTLVRDYATTNIATRMKRSGLPTTATAGTLASIYSTKAQYACGTGTRADGSGFFASYRVVPSNTVAVAGERFFVGMSSSVAAPTNVGPETLTNCIGLAQLSTDATQMYLVYGGSAAQTPIALGAANFPAGTFSTVAYDLTIHAPSDQANTYHVEITNIGTGAKYTTTLTGAATVVPQSTTVLSWRAFKTNNATAVLCAFDMVHAYFETDV